MAAGRTGEAATKYPPPVYDAQPRSQPLAAALDYARRGWPVFPCKPGGKEPLIRDWPNKATTAPRKIAAWWQHWPNANVGIVTGERSGLLVLDVDIPASLDALEAEHGTLPATRTHGTGNGGIHYLYRYPTGAGIRNSAGKLGPGLDVRGEGGYIVAPPSRTTRQYEVLDDAAVADAPPRLLERLRRSHRGAREPSGARGEIGAATTPDLAGPPIPEGTRNTTLTSIAGSLHDGTRDLDALTSALLEINAARCTPPLPVEDVDKIAQSVYAKPLCKRGAPAPDTATLEALNKMEAELTRRGWRGMAGKSERDVYIALIKLSRECGTLIPAGVRVSVDYGSLGVAAGVSRRALLDYWRKGERKPGIISRLKLAGLIRPDNGTRGVLEAGAFVLLAPPAQSFTTQPCGAAIEPRVTCGETLRAPRLRWGYPGIKRLGKTRGAVIDTLEAAGGTLTLDALADALHNKRPRDLRRRVLPPLEKHGMVECSGDTVRLTADYLQALERRREATGEIAAETRDKERNKRQSAQRRERLAGRDTRIPQSEAERAAVEELRYIAESEGVRRSRRARRRAMHDARHLQPLPTLTGMVGRRVRTPRGTGELWDYKGDEARVVLDADTTGWIPVDVTQVEVLQEAV